MSKIVAGTAFVLLSGATVTGGVLLLNKGSSKTEEQIDYELPSTNFKDSVHQEGCVQGLFKGLQPLSSATETGADASSTPLDTNYFTDGNKKKTEGCLVVNWDKETYTSTTPNKWKGTFRFLWAVKGENDKGFVVFLLGTSSTDSTKKIKWEGGALSLTLEGADDSKQWKVKKKHEISSSGNDAKGFQKPTDSNPSEDNSKFPRPGDALGLGNDKKFWGFFAQESDVDNICGTNDCAESSTKTQSKLRGYWEWKSSDNTAASGTSKKLSDWTKNLDKWWPETFGDSFKVKDVADNQTGTWTARFMEPKATTAS